MKPQFTKEQLQAIELHKENILVSAAAGSGKTAVLVERIIRMISNPEEPVDIDRLLIVTFTNAAAAQMRERISEGIAERLGKEPGNTHLQRQSALIHNAQITTIHSFCLFVIRNHFQEIGLDPAFRVADEGEISLLMQDVLAEVLEEEFAAAEEQERSESGFLRLVETYGTGKRETLLEENVLSLYRFAMSHPWPESWLREHAADYRISTKEELESAPFMQYGLSYLGKLIPELAEEMRRCKTICEEPDGPYMYGENVEKTWEGLEKASEAQTFEEYRRTLENIEFARLSAKKDTCVSPEKREMVKEVRSRVKKKLEQLSEQFFTYGGEAVLEQCRKVSPVVEELAELTIRFMHRLEAKKRERNILDFSDMEHLALRILCRRDETDGFRVKASQAALELRDYFQEIMVDEYQDSNLVQECILSCISGEEEGNYNRFMVGDVKQSIYKFRLARPELFMEKFHTYSEESGPCRRIDLHRNFRSRREVIDSVNVIFERLMAEDLGGISYDGKSRLYCGADYGEKSSLKEEGGEKEAEFAGEATKGRYQAELLIIEKEDGKTAEEQEAEAVAARIRSLLKTGRVLDKNSGMLRSVRYGDIVILLRSASGLDEIFRRVLESCEIPCFISTKTGYFQTSEVQNILQLLRILDNPLQDIPLFGVLKSFFGGFSDEELAKIAAACPGRGKLYRKLKQYVKSKETQADKETAEKCKRFLRWHQNLREHGTWLSISELLEKIMEESHYLEYVTALPGGEQRRANAEMLLQKAADFERTSFKGLYHFIRYIDQMEKYSIDYGEASISDEAADVVRIMTIHKSKGLEFPVCIVSGMGRKLNRRDASAPVLMDMDMGVAVDYVNPELRIRQRTLRKSIMARKIQLDSQAEELRVLYVALTRAKEKLIMTGVVSGAEKKCLESRNIAEGIPSGQPLPFSLRSGAGSFLELLMAACVGNDDVVLTRLINDTEMQAEKFSEALKTINDAELFRNKLRTSVIDVKMKEYLQSRFGYRYPHQNLCKLYAKTTVSELKMAAIKRLSQADRDVAEGTGEAGKLLFEEEAVIPYLPAFMKKEERKKVSGAARGSAMHRVMELLDFREETPELSECLRQWRECGLLTEEYAEAVRPQKIVHFMESPLAKRMKAAAKAGKLYREQPFVLGITADRLDAEFPAGEQVLIQGIIDVFFEEGGELVLLDYKTDVIETEKELADRYRVQLAYYAEALERITGKRVKEKLLYSFFMEKVISLEDKNNC